MTITLLLVFQFIGPVVVGLIVTRYLRMVTWRLLIDLCGTADRADFWVRVSAVLMIAAPFVLVLAAGGSPLKCSATDAICAASVLRTTLIAMLLGVLVTVGTVASVIGRYIPRELQSNIRPEASA